MEIVVCPNCGSPIDIPKSMPFIITCKKCGESFGVEYDPSEFGIWGKAKIKYNDFSVRHPKILKTVKAVGTIVAVAGVAYLLHRPDENTTAIDSAASSDPEESSVPIQSGDSYDDSDYDEEDDYSLNGCCRTCGASLDDAFYTMPWEDDDNEYGYWTCRRCHAKNYDWDSGDD